MAMACGKCGAQFDTQEELDKHVREQHPEESKEDEPEGG